MKSKKHHPLLGWVAQKSGAWRFISKEPHSVPGLRRSALDRTYRKQPAALVAVKIMKFVDEGGVSARNHLSMPINEMVLDKSLCTLMIFDMWCCWISYGGVHAFQYIAVIRACISVASYRQRRQRPPGWRWSPCRGWMVLSPSCISHLLWLMMINDG